jgi:phage virion morphogenesis protein
MPADSLDGLQTYLADLSRRLTDPALLQPAYRECADVAAAGMRQHFERGAGPDGTPWAPLKRRRGRPLVKTGLLLASVGATAGPQGLVLSASAPYAGYHQSGTRTIPARPFVGASAETLAKIMAALERHVAGLIEQGGASAG